MPGVEAYYLPGDLTYNAALPKSYGGTVMPTDSTQQGQQAGGGDVNTSGKDSDRSSVNVNNVIEASNAALVGAMDFSTPAGGTTLGIIETNVAISCSAKISNAIDTVMKQIGYNSFEIFNR